MKGFKRCANGHFFKEELTSCPHCSSTGANQNLGDTKANQSTNFDKTQIFGQQGQNNDSRTQVVEGNEATQVFGASPKNVGAKRDLNKTYIGGVTNETSEEGIVSQPRAARMITGWIVSFSLDNMGVDYRIYEGNNTIGRDPGNSIAITADSTISSKHANILHKKGKFWIKDEMAANGTFVNNEEIEIEKAVAIKDGDEIRLGDTTFIFKTWH
jgi:hypothetical protein